MAEQRSQNSNNNSNSTGNGEERLLKAILNACSGQTAEGVVLGIGDDAALLEPSAGMQLVCSTDSLVEGVHFFADTPAFKLGWKSLAVNLSDLAAMGAVARWVTLSISQPHADQNWVQEFMQGFMALAAEASVSLVGGDLCRGALNINVCALGEVEPAQALRRAGASAGDDLWVSGLLGGAALAVARLQAGEPAPQSALQSLLQPRPRLKLGRQLIGVASSAMDLSDGLLRDLPRLLPDGVGARVETARLPLHPALDGLAAQQQVDYAMLGGDDYELLFSAPEPQRQALEQIPGLARIGQVTDQAGIHWLGADGTPMQPPGGGFEHFPEQQKQ